MSEEWLQDLKAGDRVIVTNMGHVARDSVATVSRITKTQIITDKGFRFRRHNGDSCDERMTSPWLKEYTSEAAEEIRRLGLASYLQYKVRWHELSLETLTTVIEALKSSAADEKEKADG